MASNSPESSLDDSASTSDASPKKDCRTELQCQQDPTPERKRKRSIEVIIEKFYALSEVLRMGTKREKVHDFTYVSNREQFPFNAELMGKLEHTEKKAGGKVSKLLKATITKLKTQNKIIKMANRSKAGWWIVEEYLTDDIASDSKDDRKMQKAEKAALKKIKEEKQKKQDAVRKPWRNATMTNDQFRNAPSPTRNKAADICF